MRVSPIVPAELVRRSLGGDKSESIGNFPDVGRHMVSLLPDGGERMIRAGDTVAADP
jgi:hypothetical protein